MSMSDKQPETIKQALNYLAKAVAHAITTVEAIDPNDLNTLLKAFKLLDDQITELASLEKELKKVFEKLDKKTLPDMFQRLEIDSIKIAGYNFILSTNIFASIPEDKHQKGFDWLREQGYGALIKEAVHARSLASVVKSYIETTAIEPPEDVMSIHRQTSISIRKAGS